MHNRKRATTVVKFRYEVGGNGEMYGAPVDEKIEFSMVVSTVKFRSGIYRLDQRRCHKYFLFYYELSCMKITRNLSISDVMPTFSPLPSPANVIKWVVFTVLAGYTWCDTRFYTLCYTQYNKRCDAPKSMNSPADFVYTHAFSTDLPVFPQSG